MHSLLRPGTGFSRNQRQCRFRREPGLSLLEIAMLMMILSLALIPVVQRIGGPGSTEGNAARVVGLKSKELLLANTLIEQALANNFETFNCGQGQTFNPANFPAPGLTKMFPATGRCENTHYRQPLYYQWTVRNAQPAGTTGEMPDGNQFFNAVLNVYDSNTATTPMLTLPASFFYNAYGATVAQSKTGIIVIQDISGSMLWAQHQQDTLNALGEDFPNSASTGPPYLRYRYADSTVGYTPPAGIALEWANGSDAHNDQLDVVSAKVADDPATAWDDRYLGNGALGVGHGGSSISDCTSNANWNSSNWRGSELYSTQLNASMPGLEGAGHSPKTILNAICNRSPDWNTMMNNNMSRIEAARGSLLNFIVSLEADPTLYKNTKLGFVTFSSPNGPWGNNPSWVGYDVRVALESIDANNRYSNMRRQISWLNREGPGQINAYNGTNYTGAIRKAATDLFNDQALNNRFILLVSDGEPNGPGDTHAQLSALATRIGNGTYPGANGQPATIFTLGLMSAQPQMPVYLRDDLANNTPGGQYFQAQNVGDVTGMFDQIKYQIQRMILLNKVNRYNVDFT